MTSPHRPSITIAPGRGFTLVEIIVTVIIIAVLVGLVFAALGPALKTARLAGEQQALIAVKMGIEQFHTDFGVYPPVVDDANPVTGATVNIRTNVYLAADPGAAETRYSTRTLAYYLFGTLGKDVDGKDGVGFTAVGADGQFTRRGKSFDPPTDLSRDRRRITGEGENATIVDRWGNAVRYYRWLPTIHASGAQRGEIDEFRVPRVFGDPKADPKLRSAQYGLLSLGQNQATDERGPVPDAGVYDLDKALASDDIKEIGQ